MLKILFIVNRRNICTSTKKAAGLVQEKTPKHEANQRYQHGHEESITCVWFSIVASISS